MTITIFAARKIITMNPSRPLATHVAVRDGRILGVGSLDELKGWGAFELDTRFRDCVLMPGFVEGHSHVAEGAQWRFTYCGYFDRMDPDGKVWSGAKSVDAIVARLREANDALTDPVAPLSAWGLDPIYFDNKRISRADLDRVSTERPVGIMHASGHIMNVNSKALALAGMLKPGTNHPGVPLGADGLPTGELKGPDVMTPVGKYVGLDRGLLYADENGLRAFGRLCTRVGVTTATDLANPLNSDAVAALLKVTGEADFPARIVPLKLARGGAPGDAVGHAADLKSKSTDRLRFGIVKIVVDGSIQGFSARLLWPGYYNGAGPGLWYVTPEQLRETLVAALAQGIQVHAHTNGDQATELVLDTMEAALLQHPRGNHRFTLQHCQLANTAQFRRMRTLGMCVNLFANHHFYWGDQHYATTVGPERAERMNACATAQREGVPFTIHSDAPVTPLAPLFTAWCAVNRQTASGRILGTAERIDVASALQAITIGAAYTLKLDHEIGSIECGKRSDFALLDDDPLTVAPTKLRDIGVVATVLGGRVFETGAA